MRLVVFVAMVALCAASWLPAAADGQEIQAMLGKLPDSPRLFLLRGEEYALRRRIDSDPQLKAVWQLVLRSSDDVLNQPVLHREMIGRRLLATSREFLRRMTHLGLAYRLTSDKKYADRAKQDMLAVAAFTDWNPAHFLDTAEMTAAMAIGLDWCYDTLDEQTRSAIRDAIITKGLEPSVGKDYWSKQSNNWNPVCNAGMTLGGLMVAEQQPELAGKMVTRAIEDVPRAMHEYAPDGAYPEGPMYWDYGTTFNVLLISALQKATGSDHGLLTQPGFDRTADYFVHEKGPCGWFNYSDCARSGVFSLSPAMQYFAAWQKRPGLLFDENKMLQMLVSNPDVAKKSRTDRLLPMLLIWAAPGVGQGIPASTHYVAQGMTPVALFRSSWDDDATFAAIKAGQASASHGHMDVGSFVVDMLGARFAEDLGMQDYHSLESIGINMWNGAPDGERWKVFRIGVKSHNVLTVDGKNPVVNGRAELVATTDHSARVDLTKVYAGQLAAASRELSLNPDHSVSISDELQATGSGGVIRWSLVTRATPELAATGATLTRDGKQVKLMVTGNVPAEMKTFAVDPRPEPYDAENKGVTIIGFERQLKPGEKANWTVQFVPVR